MMTAGTDGMPTNLAAHHRACPARSMLFSSSKTGLTNPNALMLSAICWICFFECVRTFFGLGLIRPRGTSLCS